MINNNSQNEKKDALLPPPEIIERYQDLNLGEDLIELVKTEQEHRHNMQKKYLLSFRLGQILNFVLWSVFICYIFDLIYRGKDIQAYILTGIVLVVAILVPIILNSQNIKKIMIRRAGSSINNRGRDNRNQRSRRYNNNR